MTRDTDHTITIPRTPYDAKRHTGAIPIYNGRGYACSYCREPYDDPSNAHHCCAPHKAHGVSR